MGAIALITTTLVPPAYFGDRTGVANEVINHRHHTIDDLPVRNVVARLSSARELSANCPE